MGFADAGGLGDAVAGVARSVASGALGWPLAKGSAGITAMGAVVVFALDGADAGDAGGREGGR